MMNVVPKSDKRKNKRKITESFKNLLDTENRLNNSTSENTRSGKNTKRIKRYAKRAFFGAVKRK